MRPGRIERPPVGLQPTALPSKLRALVLILRRPGAASTARGTTEPPVKAGNAIMAHKELEARRQYGREYNRTTKAARRREWIEANGPCRRCGSADRLEVDHVDPKLKSIEITDLWLRRREIREIELSKCQVLCERCHQEKTTAAVRKPIDHGSVSTYRTLRCRCDKCRAGNAARNGRRT